MKKTPNHPKIDLNTTPTVLQDIDYYRGKFEERKTLDQREEQSLRKLYLDVQSLAQNIILFGNESHTQYLSSISEVINNFLNPFFKDSQNSYQQKITTQNLNLTTFPNAEIFENVRVQTLLRVSMEILRYKKQDRRYVRTLQNEALLIGFDSEDEIELPQKMLDFTYSQTQIENIINEQRRERNEEFIAKMLEAQLWDAFVMYHELLNRQQKVAGKITKNCGKRPDNLLVVFTSAKENPLFRVGEKMMSSKRILGKNPAENLAQIVQQSINGFEEIGLEHDFLVRQKVLQVADSVGLKSGIFKS